jgi:septum formation protein
VPRLILASKSPRRLALLQAAGFDVVVQQTAIDETPLPNESPAALVRRLAEAKAAAIAPAAAGGVVVAADTTVALGHTIFNKPDDDDHARAMLRALSGQAHTVLTGVCVARHGGQRSFVEETRVWFRVLSESDIEAYLRTGEHTDKAGAYGIQGAAAVLVARVEGCLTNVIGLPIAALLLALQGDKDTA